MEYLVKQSYQYPGFAALEPGEVVSGLPYLTAEQIEALVAAGTIEVASGEGAKEATKGESAPVAPVAEMKPHHVGGGRPAAGTWEAEEERTRKTPGADKAGRE